MRPRYLAQHIHQMWKAVNFNWPIKGYFHWSLMDNLNWSDGYRSRFGIVHVDSDTLKRTIKKSGEWYREVLADNALPPTEH